MMPELSVGRLALSLTGLSEQDGRRLARLIADGLAGAPIAEAAARRVDAVRVEVPAGPDTNLQRLAEEIIAEVLRQLA